MSKGHTLRFLVNARLTEAAEEIFALVERTIAEYEDELCRSKEENQRKQELLDKVLTPQVLVHRADIQAHPFFCPEKIPETPKIKEELEEQSVTQQEEQLPEVTVTVRVKNEEEQPFSVLHQRQTEHRDETQVDDCVRAGDDNSLDSQGHLFSETEEQTDDDEDWEPPDSSLAAQMDTEADEDHQYHIRIKDMGTDNCGLFNEYNHGASETNATVKDGHVSGAVAGDGWKKYECNLCKKRFTLKHRLEAHKTLHGGEKPYSCSICGKKFSHRSYLDVHKRNHTGEKVHSCLFCKKTFYHKGNLRLHMRTHTGEKPFSCTVCGKAYSRKGDVDIHMRVHTGEKPYSCKVCAKTFSRKSDLDGHMKVHTGEKPYICSVCEKAFARRGSLNQHMIIHTRDREYSCAVCGKSFSRKGNLNQHMRTHTRGAIYSCPICEEMFNQRDLREAHIRIHLGETLL